MNTLRAIPFAPQAHSHTQNSTTQLVDEYANPLYKFCCSLTFSKEDAEDLFQETFLQALKQPAKLDAAENPQGFLFSTALFIWKSWKRKHARRTRLAPTQPFADAAERDAASDENVEGHYIAQEETLAVRKIVDALPEKFKFPLILYYTIEMSIPAIAGVLHIPAGTVKSRLFKARELVRKGLVALHYEND